MDDERVRELGESLYERCVYPAEGAQPCGAVARGILADPQEHINALAQAVVEAAERVLEYQAHEHPRVKYVEVHPDRDEWLELGRTVAAYREASDG